MKKKAARYAFAFDTDGKRVHISEAVKGGMYFCPFCGGRMIAKLGNVLVHHFAHESAKECDDWYENKGPWHRMMQDLFPRDYQEVLVVHNGERHIADICIPKKNGQNLIIEFQASPMEHEIFLKRTKFWKENGDDIIWVFDKTDKGSYLSEVTGWKDKYCDRMFRWKKPSFTLGKGYMDEVPVFFYMNPEMLKWEDGKKVDRAWVVSDKPFLLLLQTCWCPDTVEGHSSFYYGFSYKPYNIIGGKVYETLNAFREYVDERLTIKEERDFNPDTKVKSRVEYEKEKG